MDRKILLLLAVVVFLTPILTVPFTVDYYNPPKELLVQLVFIICLTAWFIQGLRKGRLVIAPNRLYVFILLFCAVCAFSLIWANSRYLGIKDFALLLSFAGTFFVCTNTIRIQRDIVLVAKCAFAAGALAAVYAVCQNYGFDFIRYPGADLPDWRFKLYSTFGNPDFLANYLVTVFPVGAVLYLSTQNFFKKIATLAALAVVYYAILITFSIGALLGLFAAFIFGALLFIIEGLRYRNFVFKRDWVSALAVLIIVLGLISVLLPSVVLEARASPAWRAGLSNRMMAYRTAYRMMNDHPVLGVGIGSFKYRYPEYRGRHLANSQRHYDSALLDKQRHIHVHNDYAQIWVEIGIFGAVLFGLFLLIVFKNGISIYLDAFDYKSKLIAGGILCGLAAFLVHALLSFPMHVVPDALLFWVLLGLLFSQPMRQETSAIVLEIDDTQRRVFTAGTVILAMALCIWPLKLYLSQVFLKRMVDLDRKGLIDQALVEAKTSLFFDPDSNAVIYVGNYACLIKDYASAATAYRKALQNNDEINYHIALAEAYYNDGMPRECISEYKKALFLNPFSWSVHLRLVELYAAMDMDAEAQVECEYLIANFPANEDMKKRLRPIINKITAKRFISTYGAVSINQ